MVRVPLLSAASLHGRGRARAYEGRTLEWDEKLEAKVAALTPQQIQTAMKKAIDPAKISFVLSGDSAFSSSAVHVLPAFRRRCSVFS